MSVLQPQPMRRAGLLLLHCAPVAEERQSARVRLEDHLGRDFARLLVSALAPPQGRRGSSSP
jgi:hypothetical protein